MPAGHAGVTRAVTRVVMGGERAAARMQAPHPPPHTLKREGREREGGEWRVRAKVEEVSEGGNR